MDHEIIAATTTVDNQRPRIRITSAMRESAKWYRQTLREMKRRGFKVEDLPDDLALSMMFLHQNAILVWGVDNGYYEEENMKWTLFTKRTNDPKLAWIERELDALKIPHRRNGESFHAPILEVPSRDLKTAESILARRIGRFTVDDIRDDHPRWRQ